MIKIVAKNKIIAGKQEAFIELCKELVEKSQAEPGCIAYDLHVDINDPQILTFIEAWKDEEAIAEHNASEHFTRIVPQMRTLVEENEVRKYRVV